LIICNQDFNFNIIIWLYLINKNWHQYYWFFAKHHHLVTTKNRFNHGDFFNVTITNYSKFLKNSRIPVRELGFRAVGHLCISRFRGFLVVLSASLFVEHRRHHRISVSRMVQVSRLKVKVYERCMRRKRRLSSRCVPKCYCVTHPMDATLMTSIKEGKGG